MIEGLPQSVLKSSKVVVLDTLRAFAALSVCFYHFICTTIDFVDNEYLLAFFEHGKYGVQAFFVISGFIIPWSMYQGKYNLRDFFGFLAKRLARLEPPYLVSLALAIVLLYIRHRWYLEDDFSLDLSFKRIVLHIGYLIPFSSYKWFNPVYWTLAIEFQYYILMALLFVPLLKSKKTARVIFYGLVGMLSYFSSPIFVSHWMPFFLLGILVFLHCQRMIPATEFLVTSGLAFLYILVNFSPGAFFFSILPVGSIFFFRQKRIWLLDQLGKFSYSIYLIHPIVGSVFINVLSHSAQSGWSRFLVLLGGVAVTITSSWCMYVVVERPSKRLSAGIIYRRKVTPVVKETEGLNSD